MTTSYYHISLSTDIVGVESAVALKNGFALGIALTIGLNQKEFGLDSELHFNSQAAVFGQAVREMRKLLVMQGAPDMDNLVIGAGDLYVTVYGGRTRLVGILLGRGLTITEAKEELAENPTDEKAQEAVKEAEKKVEEVEVKELLRAHSRYIEFSTQINPGIKNNYKTPDTLGLDRWAKVIAAYRLYPGEACFIIDAGTCITYDLLQGDGSYDGGSISLGLQMRFQALNHFTERLPLVKSPATDAAIPEGVDTFTAIQQGVLQGAVHEVAGFITKPYTNNNKIKVLITGGDAPFFLNQLKGFKFAGQVIHEPYLVLKGLNEVIAFEYVQKN